MSSKLTEALRAADTDAALVSCGENLETSKPLFAITWRTQRVRVLSLLTSLKGFTWQMKSLDWFPLRDLVLFRYS